MTNFNLSPEETQFVLSLVREARANGITEIEYKDLKLKISRQGQETGSGPVEFGRIATGTSSQATPHYWTTSIPQPE